MMNISIGIIGCGKIVESNHIPALLNIPGVVIGWVFDKSKSRSSLISEMYGLIAISEQDLEPKISEVDICLLAVPYGVRSSYIRMCAEMNKAIYVEKPFAVTPGEHKEYCDLFPGHKLAVGFQRRYYKTVQDLKDIIQQGIFGKLHSIEFRQGYFQLKGGSGFISNAAMSGGGVIIESAIHTLDQILLFTEASQVDVLELKTISKNGIDYDTVFSGNISSASGEVKYNCHISSLRNLDNGVSLTFENAVVELMPSPASVLNVKGPAETFSLEYKNDKNKAESVNHSFVLFWMDFINAYKTGKPNQTSGVSSLLTSEWIGRIYSFINNN